MNTTFLARHDINTNRYWGLDSYQTMMLCLGSFNFPFIVQNINFASQQFRLEHTPWPQHVIINELDPQMSIKYAALR